MHRHLKRWWAESKPVLILAVEQETLLCRREILEPLQRLLIRPITDRYGDIDMLAVPVELRGEEDDFGLVGTKPIG